MLKSNFSTGDKTHLIHFNPLITSSLRRILEFIMNPKGVGGLIFLREETEYVKVTISLPGLSTPLRWEVTQDTPGTKIHILD